MSKLDELIIETITKQMFVTNEGKIIALLKQEGSMSANMLSIYLGITGRQAQRILAKSKKEGRIMRHGQIKTVTGKL